MGKLTDQKEDESQVCALLQENECGGVGFTGSRGISHIRVQVYDILNKLQQEEDLEQFTMNTRILGI